MAEEINHFSHEEHPLLLSQVRKKTICYGCQEQILEPTAYCCFSCDFFLHKRCAELPLEITHPMHPQDPLQLLKGRPPYYSNLNLGITCDVCNRRRWKFFTYHCKSCEFDMDVSCANIVNIILEHESHEHPMLLQQRPATLYCNACDQKEEDSSYMCITCPFWIHKRCASLPRSVKHKNHNHSLSLAYSLPVEYQRFKQLCPVCHFRVYTAFWVYYCGPCRYFVHLKCIVISQEDTEQQPWEDINNSISFAEVQNEVGLMAPESSSRQVGAVNNYINGLHDQFRYLHRSSTYTRAPPAPVELVENIISIKHQQPIAELEAANRARDGVTVKQSGNEATDLRKQGCSSYTLESEQGITREILEQNSSRKLKDAAIYLGVSRSTLKRICRKHNIHRWPPRKATKSNQVFAQLETVQPFAENTEEHSSLDATRLQEHSSITVKATYREDIIKFQLSFSARKMDLEEKVAQRLNLTVGSFRIKYLDEDGDWVLVTCDEDFITTLSTLRSLGRTTIKLHLDFYKQLDPLGPVGLDSRKKLKRDVSRVKKRVFALGFALCLFCSR